MFLRKQETAKLGKIRREILTMILGELEQHKPIQNDVENFLFDTFNEKESKMWRYSTLW